MSVTIRLPKRLHAKAAPEIVLDEPLYDVGSVQEALTRRFPSLEHELASADIAVAVNDVLLRQGVTQYPVRDGDVIEIVPAAAST